MNGARIGILALAVVAAITAAVLVSSFVGGDSDKQVSAEQAQLTTSKVLVAASDIRMGQTIDRLAVRWQTWPQEGISSSFVSQDKDPQAITNTKGAIARVAIYAGEPVTKGKILMPGTAGFMAGKLSSGMRAVSIETSPETGAGGFILPNDRVDVILTRRERGTTGSTRGQEFVFSETVLANVRVLAIDQEFRELNGEQVLVGKTATLELPPAFTEALILAEAMGDLSLALRSLADGFVDGQEGPVLMAGIGDSGATGNVVTVVRFGQPARMMSAGSR